MRLFLSGLIAGVLVVGAWLMLAAYLGSIEFEGNEREPRERVARDTPTRTIEDEPLPYDSSDPTPFDPRGKTISCGGLDLHFERDAFGKDAVFVEEVQIIYVLPEAPEGVNEDGRDHWVAVEYCIEATGATSNIEVFASEPSSLWDEAAVAAVSKWKYVPASINGIDVRVCACQRTLTMEGFDEE